jgi:recombinational DNA repair ATPase RecF
MYRSIHIKNFRSLKNLEVSDLRRINLFVGPNSVGKTSFLEAIWLLHTPGNPIFSRNLAVFRGLPRGGQLSPELEWEPLFHNLSPKNEITISAERSDTARELLRVGLSPSTTWVSGTGSDHNGSANVSGVNLESFQNPCWRVL